MSSSAASRFGLIQFGSRREIILPKEIKLRVKVGDRVKGGETVVRGETMKGRKRQASAPRDLPSAGHVHRRECFLRLLLHHQQHPG